MHVEFEALQGNEHRASQTHDLHAAAWPKDYLSKLQCAPWPSMPGSGDAADVTLRAAVFVQLKIAPGSFFASSCKRVKHLNAKTASSTHALQYQWHGLLGLTQLVCVSETSSDLVKGIASPLCSRHSPLLHSRTRSSLLTLCTATSPDYHTEWLQAVG